jgi:hypothetical protein
MGKTKAKARSAEAAPAAPAVSAYVGYQHPPREHCFKPGESGNPAGRRRGSRNRLNERFLDAMCEDFDQHGRAVIERVRTDSPAVYLRVVARLLPAHLLVQEARLDHLSDSELSDYLAVIAKILGRGGAGETNAAIIEGQAQAAPPAPRDDGTA